MDEPISTLLVDDEPLALTNLRAVLARDPSFAITGEQADGARALKAIATLRPALVFLDVQMPGMDGVEVARRLVERGRPPLIVFVTAYDQFAIDAFELHAVDYLLKPYSDARLHQTLARCRAALSGHRLEDVTTRLSTLVDTLSGTPRRNEAYLRRILIPDAGRTRIVLAEEIIWIAGAKNYVDLHTERELFVYRNSLDAMEATLDPQRFARIHRSTIVCLDRIREVEVEGGRRSVTLDNGNRLSVSRTYVEQLMARLGR